MSETLLPVVALAGLVALALAALRWGADSRPDPGRERPRRWFIHLADPDSGPAAEGHDRAREPRAGHGSSSAPSPRTVPHPSLPAATAGTDPAVVSGRPGSAPLPRPPRPTRVSNQHDPGHGDRRAHAEGDRPVAGAGRR
jgi:hypothetical protein